MISFQLCLCLAPLLTSGEGHVASQNELANLAPFHFAATFDSAFTAVNVADRDDDEDDEEDDDDDDDKKERDRDKKRDGNHDGDREHRGEGHKEHAARNGERHDRERPDHERHNARPEQGREADRHPGHRPEAHRPDGHSPDGPQGHGGRMHGPGNEFRKPGQPPQMSGRPGMPPSFPGFGFPFQGSSPGRVMFGGTPSNHGHLSAIIFELLDMNHDGNLSRDEFQRLAAAVEKAHHPGPQMHPPMGPNGPHSAPAVGPGFGPHAFPMHPPTGPGKGFRPPGMAPEHGPRPPIRERLQQHPKSSEDHDRQKPDRDDYRTKSDSTNAEHVPTELNVQSLENDWI